MSEPRPFSELRDTGLLWLINRVVFHPRGYALAFTLDDMAPEGWSLLGDGSEPWKFGDDVGENELFRAAESTLRDCQTGGSDVPEVRITPSDDNPEAVRSK